MKKTLISAMLLLAFSTPAVSKELSPDEALHRARSAPASIAAKGSVKVSPRLVHTALTEIGVPAVYVFNNPDENGYLILSADDRAIPVLGYSDTGSFNAGNIPPQMEWWLSEYSRQIEYAREKNLPATDFHKRRISRSGERKPIGPLMKTKWDQVQPYNGQCPLDGTDRTWTGCVATALSQVMKYWNYPEKGTGSITYSIESLEKKVSMNFGQKKFDWDNMLNTYIEGQYTQEQADAVAYLMKACGYSVKMQYSMDASGALAMNIGRALTKYFDYDPNILYTLRQYYSSTQWDEMMYDNLLNVGPVMYGGGSALGGGHSFVCDGYDGEGMYHFNWGWSGMSDGYFSLDALNPDALGTGGGGGGGYNFTQDAVFGIQPPTGKPVEERPLFITQEGDLSGSVSSTYLSFSLVNATDAMWVNYNPVNMKVKFGAMFYPQDDSEAEPVYYDLSTKRVSLEPGYGTSPEMIEAKINLKELGLPNGTYKVVCGTVEVQPGTVSAPTDGEGFVEIKPSYGSPGFFTLRVKDGKYMVQNDIPAPLKIKGEVVGNLYYGTLTTVRVTVENPSDVERTSGFAPVFLDEQGPLLLGESIYVTIPPKATVTREWTTSLEQFVQFIDGYLDKEVYFTFFNEITFDFYLDQFLETVVLNSNPGTPKVKVSKAMKVEDSYKEGLATIITDPNDFTVTGELTLTSGYFNYPVVLCLCIPADDQQVQIISTASQMIFMSLDSEETSSAPFSINMSYPIADPDQKYYLVLTYQGVAGLTQLGNTLPVKFKNLTGIEEMEADSDVRLSYNRSTSEATVTSDAAITGIEAYDITGRRIDSEISMNGNNAVVKLAAGKGICIVKIGCADGENRVFKIIL